MREETIEISDRSGHSFKLEITTPGAWEKATILRGPKWKPLQMTGTDNQYYLAPESTDPGSWRTLSLGMIRFNGGRSRGMRTLADLTTRDLYLENVDDTWGIKFFNYEDRWGVNEQGEGVIVQPWVLAFNTGRFSWVRV